ncbi:general transcription factor IIF subunit 2-like isoform X2 [Entelurus aequoreus]|uniref:general transcription factor IIF subunit 2-like isoform X2 n=1 Tax=Entelurus aequoreus TaxID=161455 RepID=UPI002B1D2FEA|nr:general transcription factor IIF subunit 2-like isoform X2 [Entelurus aequoreus]
MSEKGEVNLAGAKQSNGVWLVKVPKYLAQQWDKATENGEVGKITIGKKQGKTKVCFSLNEELTTLGAVGEKDAPVQVPRDHPFTMNSVGGQTMAVFSQGDQGDQISFDSDYIDYIVLIITQSWLHAGITDAAMELAGRSLDRNKNKKLPAEQLSRGSTQWKCGGLQSRTVDLKSAVLQTPKSICNVLRVVIIIRFNSEDLEEYTASVLRYIKHRTDKVIINKRIRAHANQKPWMLLGTWP